jgi:hypothetical protein
MPNTPIFSAKGQNFTPRFIPTLSSSKSVLIDNQLRATQQNSNLTITMLTPAYANLWFHFYPIGNTPAVSLTQGLPPEKKADILLLGCGDPRNILFTTYCDGKLDI